MNRYQGIAISGVELLQVIVYARFKSSNSIENLC